MDNAWDAEARVVKITLPDILSEKPVVIEDDGHGMKNQEVRQEYLKIASPRFSRKGERTPNLDRKVKVAKPLSSRHPVAMSSRATRDSRS